MKKKILLISAALLLVACGGTGGGTSSSQTPGVTPSSQPAVDNTHIEGSKGLQYTLSDDETYYILTGLGSCKDDEVIIGNWYNGKPVLEVGEAALSTEEGQWGPKIIRVSEGITTIGFRGLRSRTVEYIYLPESVTTLTKATFILDRALKSVVIGSKVTKIEDDVFMECPVQDIYFRGSREDWNKIEFSDSNNSSMWNAEVHFDYKDGERIDGVVEGSKGLQYTLSDDETYYTLTGLGTCTDDNVVVGNYYNNLPVLEIGEAALSTEEGQWGPKSITVSRGITTLGFRGLRSRTVEYVYLPNTITTLTKASFILDKSLKAIVLPATLTKIEDDAFMASPVKDIYFKGTRAEWDKVEKSLNNNTTLFDAAFHYGYRNGQPIDGVVKGSEGLTYTISDDESSYAFSALGTCADKDIVIGNYYNNLPVTDIASMAISAQETDINSIKVSKGITNIGFAAIAAWKVKEIDMPSGITEYAKAQFIHCESIETVYIGHGLTKIDEDCFFHCDSTLKDIYFRGTQAEWEAIEILPTNNNLANVTIHYNYIG